MIDKNKLYIIIQIVLITSSLIFVLQGLDIKLNELDIFYLNLFGAIVGLFTAVLVTYVLKRIVRKKPKVFISYNQRDREFVEKLKVDLDTLNLAQTYSLSEVPVGENIHIAISDMILESDVFLAICSENYIQSEHCKFELSIAHKAEIMIFPIIVGKDYVVPIELSDVKAIMFDGEDFYSRRFQELVTSLESYFKKRNRAL